MRARFLLLALISAVLIGALPGPVPAQEPATNPPASVGAAAPSSQAAAAPELSPEIASAISRLVTLMETAEKSLGRMKDLDDDIGRLRDEVEDVISTSTKLADELRPRLAEVHGQIGKLGPPPAKDGPPEAAPVAAERARLAKEASALDGAIKTLELTWVRARQTIDKITDLRLALFTRSLMERMSSPLLPGLWSDVVRDLPQVGRFVTYVATDWISTAGRQWGKLVLLGLAALAALAGLRKLICRFVSSQSPRDPDAITFFAKAAFAAWAAPLRAMPAILACLIAYGGLDLLGLLYYPGDRIAAALLRAAMIFAGVSALINTALSPGAAAWRVVPLSDGAALKVSRLLQGVVAVYAADLAFMSISRALYFPLSMSVVQSLLASLALTGLMIGLLLTPFAAAGEGGAAVSRLAPRWLKVPLWAATGFVAASTLFGYVALGRFAAQQLVMTGVLVVTAILLFLAIRAFTRGPDITAYPLGHALGSRIDASRRQQLVKLVELSLTLLLFMLALPILMLQWGFSAADVRDWVKAAIFGFEIGQFRISIARILIGIVLFTFLLAATRVLQRWLREQILAHSRVDPGIANSIDTAIGYAGVAVAAILAISYAGLDITSLAILAGALSVGIGFGLQSIVNNFVSGLILLVERPIKVGDWIVVGNEQGYVRRVSVRSTEIETFDKASLIVPNSELVTGRVLNWTHRNTLGRVTIKFGIAADSDPRSVMTILRQCAETHPGVLRFPECKVLLENATASTLEFSVRLHVGDVNRALDIQSELRLSMLEHLRQAGVKLA